MFYIYINLLLTTILWVFNYCGVKIGSIELITKTKRGLLLKKRGFAAERKYAATECKYAATELPPWQAGHPPHQTSQKIPEKEKKYKLVSSIGKTMLQVTKSTIIKITQWASTSNILPCTIISLKINRLIIKKEVFRQKMTTN